MEAEPARAVEPAKTPNVLVFKTENLKQTEGDVLVTVALQASGPAFPSSTSFARHLSEFDRLYHYLIQIHPATIAPASPPKSTDLAFVKRAVQLFLDRIAANLYLVDTEGLKEFVYSKFLVLFAYPVCGHQVASDISQAHPCKITLLIFIPDYFTRY